MAGISTAIRINDQMSPALRGMNKALMIVLNTFESMQSATQDPINTAAISEARRELAGVSVTLDQVEKGIRDAQNEQERFTQEAHNTQNALSGIANGVRNAIASYATLQTVQKAAEMSDTISNNKARLSMIVDDGGSVQELEQKIFDSANRAGANYLDMADSVSKLSLNAPDAFSSNDETIQFAENLNKMFGIAGTSAESINSATLQLTQALGSGVLRGEELNAVFEAAPNIIQEVADYMGVSIGKIRNLASEGQLSAEVVKNAILGATDEINDEFNKMPMTFSAIWNKFQSYATLGLTPVWEKLSAIASSTEFNDFIVGAATGIAALGNMLVYAFDALASLGSFVYNNWSMIAPVLGVIVGLLGIYATALTIAKGAELASAAVTAALTTAKLIGAAAMMLFGGATWSAAAAQMGLNTQMYACPIVWIIALILAVIAVIALLVYAAIAAWNKITGSTVSATGIIAGALATAGAFIWNNFLALLDLVLGVVNILYNKWAMFANFFGNLFNDPIGAIIHLFGDMADTVLGILESIAKAIDSLFGSNLAEAVSGWRSGLDGAVENLASTYGNGEYEEIVSEANLSSSSLGLNRIEYGNAWDSGYSWGEGVGESISNFSLDSLLGDTGFDLSNAGKGIDPIGAGSGYGGDVPAYEELSNIADDTSAIKDSVEVSEEDLKYLRDVAEMETINRFTTAEISVDMGGVNNNISSEMDIDGFMDVLSDKLYETMTIAAEGMHD